MLLRADSRIVSGFLDYLKVEKGLRPLTIAAYDTDLGQFAGFLESKKRTLAKATRDDVRNFIQQLFANGVDGRSVGRKLSALRHFYRYLLLDKIITADPTLNIDSPKQWKVLPKALARDEMEIMLRASIRSAGRAGKQRPSRCETARCWKFSMRGRFAFLKSSE